MIAKLERTIIFQQNGGHLNLIFFFIFPWAEVTFCNPFQ